MGLYFVAASRRDNGFIRMEKGGGLSNKFGAEAYRTHRPGGIVAVPLPRAGGQAGRARPMFSIIVCATSRLPKEGTHESTHINTREGALSRVAISWCRPADRGCNRRDGLEPDAGGRTPEFRPPPACHQMTDRDRDNLGLYRLIPAPTLRRSEVRSDAGRIQIPDLTGRALTEV
jgi:hypothetical protein